MSKDNDEHPDELALALYAWTAKLKPAEARKEFIQLPDEHKAHYQYGASCALLAMVRQSIANLGFNSNVRHAATGNEYDLAPLTCLDVNGDEAIENVLYKDTTGQLYTQSVTRFHEPGRFEIVKRKTQ